MSDEVDALCVKPHRVPELVTRPMAAPIFPATVFACDSPAQASQLLAGQTEGFVYSRDGHPNAFMLAQRCAELHGAQQAIVTGSGMGALGLALLSLLKQGDHIVASRQLYGRSIALFSSEARRLGIETSLVDTCDLQSTAEAMTDRTRLLVTETISNPMLRVADIAALAELTGQHQAKLLVDNTFASPAICQPLAWGADLVMESITKIMNGHSDVMLGLLCGQTEAWQRVPMVHTTWGLFASPLDCWLAARGLSTLGLRAAKASENAAAVATTLSKPTLLSRHRDLVQVSYPGLTSHPDHQLAARQFGDRSGNMVTFTLRGGWPVAERFIAAAADRIPFCPSLGELFTTLSHPASTSHRGLTPPERLTLGIEDGTIRLSVGCEPVGGILQSLDDAIQAAVA